MDYTDYLKPSKLNRQKRRDKRLYEELIECRRWGGGDSNKKWRDKGQNKKHQQDSRRDSLPQREAYSPKTKRTMQDDNLEPMIRFLESHKGQAWDKVYSKLNKQLDKRSTIGMHVLDHLWDYVALNTELDHDGKILIYNKWGNLKRWHHSRFYVHPKTGMLCSNDNKPQKGPYPKKARWKKEKQKIKWKKRLGLLETKPQKNDFGIYKLSNICTTDQTILVKQEYDYCKGKFLARLKITKDMSRYRAGVNVYLYLKTKVVKSNFKWMIGSEIRLLKYYVNDNTAPDWHLFDVGKFEF